MWGKYNEMRLSVVILYMSAILSPQQIQGIRCKHIVHIHNMDILRWPLGSHIHSMFGS